jgi:uncharacterized protein YcfL
MKNPSFPEILILILLAGAVVLPACSTVAPVNTVERAQPVARRDMVPDNRVFTSARLNPHVRVLGVNQSTGPGGLLRVQVEVLNTTRSLQTFNYRWEWLDETGTIIETPTSTAVTRQIEGRESLLITGVAPNDRAKDFRLKLTDDHR